MRAVSRNPELSFGKVRCDNSYDDNQDEDGHGGQDEQNI